MIFHTLNRQKVKSQYTLLIRLCNNREICIAENDKWYNPYEEEFSNNEQTTQVYVFFDSVIILTRIYVDDTLQ